MSVMTDTVARLGVVISANTVEYVDALAKAQKITDDKLKRIEDRFKRTGRTSQAAGKKIDGLSGRLKNMAQSAALVSGPMGGIASRLSILSGVVAAGPLVGGVVALTLALTGMYKVMASGIMNTDKTIIQLSQLEGQLKLTGNSVGISSGALDAFARELALNTLTSTEEVRSAMSMLITTTNLTGDSFRKVTTLAQDYAQIGFGSITSNAKMMAKALADPIKGMQRLERLHVNFTESQKANIEQLVESNQMYKATTIMIDAMGKSIENVARLTGGKTVAEQTDLMAQRWGELTEAITKSTETHPKVVEFLASVNSMLNAITGKVSPEFGMDLDSHKEVAEELKVLYGDVNDLIDGRADNAIAADLKYAEEEAKRLTNIVSALKDANIADQIFDGEGALYDMPGAIGQVATSLSKLETLKNSGGDDQLNTLSKQLSMDNARIEALKTLQKSLITNREDLADRGVEIDKKAEAERMKSVVKAAEEMAKIFSGTGQVRYKEAEKASKQWKDMIDDMSSYGMNVTAIQFQTGDTGEREAWLADYAERKTIVQSLLNDIITQQKAFDSYMSSSSGASAMGTSGDGKKKNDLNMEEAEAKWKSTMDLISTLDGFANTDALDIEYMKEEDLQLFYKRVGLAFKFKADLEADALTQYESHLAAKEALRMEAEFGVGDAETQLLVDKYATQLEDYRKFLTDKGLIKSEIDAKELTMASAMGEALFTQTMQSQSQQTKFLTDNLNVAMNSMSALGKDGSKAAKALFLVNQGIAIGNAIISKGVAVGKASELPAPANIPAMAMAEAMGIANIASIAAATIGGVAHGGMDSVPSESTFLLQKGERVIQPKANKDLTAFLSNGGNSNGGNVSISAPLNIAGNVTDQSWFQAELYKHRQLISDSVKKAQREKPRR